MADNLIQKRGESTWYVRLAVPADVQAKLGCKVLIQSLKTGLRREAMVRRLPILDEWKKQIESVRVSRSVRGDEWKESVADFSVSFDQAIRKLKTDAALGEREEPAHLTSDQFQSLSDDVFDDSPQGRANQKRADEVFAMTGLEAEMATLDLAKEFALQMMGKVFAARHDLSPVEREDMTGILDDPKSRKPRSPITTARLKAFREFREGQKAAPKHLDQQIGRMERLSDFLKKQSLPLDFDSVALWIRSLDRAPATLNQHLLSGSAFWAWAVKYDPGFRAEYKDKADPFKAHDVPQGGGRETSGEQREAYTTTQLETLYKGAQDAKNQPLADLILLGAYTGSRIEQLCQLRVEHIIKEDGIPSFDFRGGKNKAAKRIVPIHPAIRSLVDRLVTESTDGFLIPASSENRYGKRSHALSKAFGYLKKTQGFGPLHVFHGMRNTAITAMLRANVPDHVVMEMVGHATGTETHDTYSHGASAKQKLRAISKLPTLRVD